MNNWKLRLQGFLLATIIFFIILLVSWGYGIQTVIIIYLIALSYFLVVCIIRFAKWLFK